MILGFYTYLAWEITKRLGYTLDQKSFFVAMLVAIFTGATWFGVSDWWFAATRPDRPQEVILKTPETPNQVASAGCSAMIKLILFVLGMIAVLAYFLVSAIENLP